VKTLPHQAHHDQSNASILLAFQGALPYDVSSEYPVFANNRTIPSQTEHSMSIEPFPDNRLKTVLVMISIVASLLAKPALADEARLTDIVATSSSAHLLLYFRVTDCFTDEMISAIENGINTTFTFFIGLYEVRDLQLDEDIAELKVTHSIVYDNLKKVYKVRLSERHNKMILVEDFREAKNLMSRIEGVKLTDLNTLQKGTRYEIRMMAELDKIRLPLYLDYVLFFLSLWDFETDWYKVNFTY
jgi:predicted DNA-binding protein YlxM (UPF0122 family)